ncbi:unnamed protein product [Tuber melanosporum]|uniref:(Perigord truffle) hypothetical protein n=1 Tax=Tuber melanosporum (strain Mel28) TaxID=656061 RepID=D5G5Q9_TUBMM|nr:unnamed protein product [Tuber melanosporum]
MEYLGFIINRSCVKVDPMQYKRI